MRRRAILVWCHLLAIPLLGAGAPAAELKKAEKPKSLPVYRVETEGFEAGAEDIRAVLDSAARELWRYFPDDTIEPIVVTRGHHGPITLYRRNEKHEIVVRLDTGRTYWAQYAYQFSHELCHILCGYREGFTENKWFEETLCETASLFVLRSMSRSWKADPPYANWAEFRDALRQYADDVIRGRVNVHEIYAHGLAGFYRAHRAELERDPASRELNGAMALALLQLLEEQPEQWGAVRWLNATPAPKGEPLADYLQRWHDACPLRHQAFVRQVAELYGIAIRKAGEDGSAEHRAKGVGGYKA